MKYCLLRTIVDRKASFGKVMPTMRSFSVPSGMISYMEKMAKMSYMGSKEMIESQEED